MPGVAKAPLSEQTRATYERHRPERTPLYPLVVEHLETLLAQVRERTEHGFGYPRFVERTFRDFIDCGRLELGFTRVVCGSCGFERLVAFSCKRRGLCPSCEARRTSDTALHLVDRVLPAVPFRHWVLSLPIAARLLLLRDKALVSQVLRIFIRRVFAWQRRMARELGIIDGQGAAVSMIQRWGGALNANPHFHSLIPDGVFEQRPDGHVRFVPLLAPSDDDVHRICGQVAWRVDRLLQGHADELEWADPDETPASNLTLALAPCTPRRISNEGWEHPQRTRQLCAEIDGFSLYAATAVAAGDRAGLERLCRYGLRSSFTLNRLSLLEDGRVCYRLKRPWPGPGGMTQLVMDPVDFLARLANLLPPPRSNLVRYYGAFAPNAAIRARLLPRLERAKPQPPCSCPRSEPTPHTESQGGFPAGPPQPPTSPVGTTVPGRGPSVLPGHLDDANVPPMLIGAPLDPHDLLPIRQRYLDWATLLKRVHKVDILDCPRCHGRLKLLAAISDPPIVKKILEHLQLPSEPPCPAPARAPPQTELDC